ncbi:MAG: PhoH family protein [Thiotrichales bacterium]|nr:PhoH family protein [Thiotrichales bacterium]
MSKTFVLDTNVLLSDPKSIHSFQEHTVYIPFIVLEELDSKKQGHTELARNAREATRQLEDVISSGEDLSEDCYRLPNGGCLRFTTQETKIAVPGDAKNDNIILNEVSYLSSKISNIVLVSNDINIRVKAKSLGLVAEGYRGGDVLSDSDFVSDGYFNADSLFSENTQNRLVQVFNAGSVESVKVPYKGESLEPFTINGIITIADVAQFKVIDQDDVSVTLVPLTIFSGKNNIWGLRAKNIEQNIAMNLLMDPDKHLVAISGAAGSGKTIIALASALEQNIESKRYKKIIFMRETITAADTVEIGFLPGELDNKLFPFLGALTENLRQLTGFEEPKGSKRNDKSNDKPISPLGQFENAIEVLSLGMQRGTSFTDSLIIVDEVQNLSKSTMKMILTRAGMGSKIILLGNVNQIDNPYLNGADNGLVHTIKAFEGCDLFGHVILKHTVRSPLADEAVKRLM